MPKNAPRFWLTNWTYCCVSDGSAVFLNIKTDRYFLLEPGQWSAVQQLIYAVDGKISNVPVAQTMTDSQEEIIASMINAGILTGDRSKGKLLSSPDVPSPYSLFEHTDCLKQPKIKKRHIIAVITAGIIIHIMLSLGLLRFIVAIMRALKKQQLECDDELEMLSEIFDRLRPLLIRSRICLYDTLVFYFFSLMFGRTPNVVFGIQTAPFGAHCWAQVGRTILNDYPARTIDYKAIMVI